MYVQIVKIECKDFSFAQRYYSKIQQGVDGKMLISTKAE